MSLPDRAQVLIVGAGPTGLAAALFLAERGIRARIIDKAAGPSTTSRAQVVNPRSLELLEPTGVTAAMLAEAHPVRGVRFTEGWHTLADLSLAELPSRFAMAALPQARTEALLADALRSRGIAPERNLSFRSLAQDEHGVRAELSCDDGPGESVETALLLAADGAHSMVREALGIGFDGHAFPESWPLYDIELDDPLEVDQAHVDFVGGGLVFLLCIRSGLWRVFGNVPKPLDCLPQGAHPGAIAWQSSFHIADRLAASVAAGGVALAGDAAHIHSPIGARGMNLGIEDAYVFAACAADFLNGNPERIAEYGRLRHPVHKSVVGRMDKLTALARGRPAWVGLLRHYLMPGMTSFGPAAHLMRDFLTGLDHPVRVS